MIHVIFVSTPYCDDNDIFFLQDIDSEVAQHLKRLARKDPTTKVISYDKFLIHCYIMDIFSS